MAPLPTTPQKPVSGQVITPDKLAAAAARANEERERIRKEAHEEGKHHGLRLAGVYRDIALICIGAIVGLVAGAALSLSIADRGAVTAAAVADQVLGRVTEPVALPAPAPSVSDAATYQRNAAAAREGCTATQLRNGERNCGR